MTDRLSPRAGDRRRITGANGEDALSLLADLSIADARSLRRAIMMIADNLIKCNEHFRVLAAGWRLQGQIPARCVSGSAADSAGLPTRW